MLRIEDTDLERSSMESVNAILEGMAWLCLEYDEGPFYQTKRFDRYDEVIQDLLERGLVYRCNCGHKRLDKLRDEAMKRKEKPRYDGHCRDIKVSSDEPHVIRFRNPETGVVAVDDLIRGRVTFNNEELDDLIIRRTDGSPTYNLTVVVDDLDMKITHVIRGDDHLNNTPRQINILQALDASPPIYGHVPMILGEDGARLSKRHGAVSVMQYQEAGFLPEAVLNYLVRLGWSHGDQEIFSVDDMIELFDIDAVNKAASSFNTDKLLWLNQHYIKQDDAKRVAHLLSPHMGNLGIDPSQGPDLVAVAEAHQERVRSLVEMAEMSAFCYQDYEAFEENAAKKHLRSAAREPLERIRETLDSLGEWTTETLHAAVERVSVDLDVKMGKVAQPLRVAVVGRAASPGIDVTLYLVGKEASLRRIDKALDYIRQREANAG